MKINFNKNKLYEILFILCVFIPYFNNYELTFFIWCLSVVLTLQKKYSLDIIRQLLCFAGILLLAFISSFFNEYDLYNFIRDVTYLVKPILGILIGYQFAKSYLDDPLKTVVIAGVFSAIVHLIIVSYGFLVIGIRNINDLREIAGYFSDFEVYIIIFLIFSKDFQIDINPRMKKIALFILIISSLLYLSRTNFIQFGILYFAVKGYFVLNKEKIILLFSIFILGILSYTAIVYSNPKRNGKGIEAFLYKIKIAPIEPFKTKIKINDYRDFNDNYRSVENIYTIKQMNKEGFLTILFGKGLGSTVNLKRKVWLDGVQLRYISILHNGFMTVYLKSGIIGLLLCLLSIFFLLKRDKSNIFIIKKINYLFFGTVIFIVLSYWVFMGLYFKADTKAILIGLLILYKSNLEKEYIS